MNEKKIIKDLKDRNDKLKMQYDYNNILLIALQQKYDRQTKQLQTYKNKEDKLREYLEKIPMSCACGQKQQDEIEKDVLQILNEGSYGNE